jgi:hypothetical protein
MLETVTIKTIVTLVLGLSLIWLIKILAKKERGNVFKALLLSAFCVAALVFIQNRHLEKSTIVDIKKQIFPEKIPEYKYRIERGLLGRIHYISYIFDEPRPNLPLSIDSEGKFLHISDVSSINRVLEMLALPKVSSGVPELASITGSRSDINKYRWEAYAGGALVIRRSLCRDIKRVESYNCISSITLEKED